MSVNNSLGVALNISTGPKKAFQVSAPTDYFAGISRKVKFLFDSKKFCDVTLISEDDKFKVEAHKLVLSAASPYFLGMFGGSLLEATAKEVKLQKIDSQTLKAIINYIYTSSIYLTSDTVEDVVKAAHLFQLDSLVVLCSDFIAQQLESSNCLGIALFAEHYDFKRLYKAAEEFVCQNFMKLRNDDEFFKLNVDQLSKYIASNKLCLPSEEEVFHTVLSWVKHDKGNREKSIGKLLKHIRFPLLPPDFIASTVEPVCKSPESHLLLYKALKWHFLSHLPSSMHAFPASHMACRNFTKYVIAILGWDNRHRNLHVGLHYSGEKEWTYKDWPAPSKGRTNFRCTTVNGKLIIAGGTLTSGEATESVECLDLKTLKWAEMPPMTRKRQSFGMVTLNGHVYALGGEIRSAFGTSDCLDKWDPSKTHWQSVSLNRAGSEALGSDIHMSAGCNAFCVSKKRRNCYGYEGDNFDHSIYYPHANKWVENWLSTNGYLLGTGIWRCSSVDYLIVVTRKEGLTKYKLDDKSSKVIVSCNIKEALTDCVLFDDRMILYGSNEFVEYDLSQNQWKTLPRLTNKHGKVVLISS